MEGPIDANEKKPTNDVEDAPGGARAGSDGSAIENNSGFRGVRRAIGTACPVETARAIFFGLELTSSHKFSYGKPWKETLRNVLVLVDAAVDWC